MSSGLPKDWLESYRKETAERNRQVKERLDIELPKFRRELLGLGIERIEADYDGSGDSGCFEGFNMYGANDEEFITEKMNLPQGGKGFKDKIIELFFDILEMRYAGWENNEGATGRFAWNLADDTLKHTHNENIVSVNTTEHEGW